MKASFDGARTNLARTFNALVKSGIRQDQCDIVERLRCDIAGLLCMYDDGNPDDCHCLIDDVPLDEVHGEEARI